MSLTPEQLAEIRRLDKVMAKGSLSPYHIVCNICGKKTPSMSATKKCCTECEKHPDYCNMCHEKLDDKRYKACTKCRGRRNDAGRRLLLKRKVFGVCRQCRSKIENERLGMEMCKKCADEKNKRAKAKAKRK